MCNDKASGHYIADTVTEVKSGYLCLFFFVVGFKKFFFIYKVIKNKLYLN